MAFSLQKGSPAYPMDVSHLRVRAPDLAPYQHDPGALYVKLCRIWEDCDADIMEPSERVYVRWQGTVRMEVDSGLIARLHGVALHDYKGWWPTVGTLDRHHILYLIMEQEPHPPDTVAASCYSDTGSSFELVDPCPGDSPPDTEPPRDVPGTPVLTKWCALRDFVGATTGSMPTQGWW